jgi:hypothetical protein
LDQPPGCRNGLPEKSEECGINGRAADRFQIPAWNEMKIFQRNVAARRGIF